MPKEQTNKATLQRFERALKKALRTSPESPRKKAKKSRKKGAKA